MRPGNGRALVSAATQMLDSAEDKKREAFRAAVERARGDGLSPADMHDVITATAETKPSNGPVLPAEPEDVMYEPGNLPGELIALPTLVKEYRASRSTLNTWIRSGKLRIRGKVRAPAPGGGYNVASKEEVFNFMSGPVNRGGRPRKAPK